MSMKDLVDSVEEEGGEEGEEKETCSVEARSAEPSTRLQAIVPLTHSYPTALQPSSSPDGPAKDDRRRLSARALGGK